MNDEERIELTQRRLAEAVTESVEKELKRRYSWLVLVVTLLVGGGSALIVNSLTSSARVRLQDAEARLKDIKGLVKQSEDSLSSITTLKIEAEEIKRKLDAEASTLAGGFEGTIKEINSLKDSIDLITEKLNLLLEDTQKVSVKSDKGKVDEALSRAALGKYLVYMHHLTSENKKETDELNIFLKEKGYNVQGNQYVPKAAVQGIEIRYYLIEESTVKELKQFLDVFFESYPQWQSTRISSHDFSKKYPNVEKPMFEIWVE